MYNQREIVLVPFPYSNLSASKRRPVLVISNNYYNKNYPDILIAVITSNLYKDDYSVTLNNDDLELGMLPEESIIKCHKLFTIEQSQILKRFSILNEKKFDEVVVLLNELIQRSN
ncbi:MAG TPA: type II toxin-antitoxin system PemK/MazF family toxin [Hanamia sp.]|jgi:mRNA interferase MazF|nr:type II toxin-antitoxin system PemK/MazF family toxin [Hanamia sp.]